MNFIKRQCTRSTSVALLCAAVILTLSSIAVFGGCSESDSDTLSALQKAERAPASFVSAKRDRTQAIKAVALQKLSRRLPLVYHGALPLLEVELLQRLGNYLHLETKLERQNSVEEILNQLRENEADIASLIWSSAEPLPSDLHEGTELYRIPFVSLCHPSAQDQLEPQLTFAASLITPEEQVFLQQQEPQLNWQATSSFDTNELLKQVENKQIDCTLTDATTWLLYRRHHSDLQKTTLPLSRRLILVTTRDNLIIQEQLQQWTNHLVQSGFLEQRLQALFGYLSSVDSYETHVFIHRIQTRLHKYQDLFERAGQRYQIDWKLLAALSYQESHWNPHAKSHTGVIGMMMLTSATARSLGVKNRRDAKESIFAGAQYLQSLLKRIPDYIPYSERMWMAMAAYNVGYAHLQDARTLAVWQGHNPNSWAELKQVLPLLAQKEFYQQLKYGAARGEEPVLFVERIRNYYEMLQWYYNEPINSERLYE